MISPITNCWGRVTARRLEVRHTAIFRGREGQSFNHQAQLAGDGARLYATWSSCARDEEEAGQQMLLATSDDAGATWSAPSVVAPARPGRYAMSVVVSSGIRVHGGRLVAYYGEWERYEAGRSKEREAERAATGRNTFNLRTEARVSADRGQSWSAPVPVVADQFGFMPPMPTASGRLILPGHLTYALSDDPAGLSGWRRTGLPGLPPDYVDEWYGHARGAAMLGLAHRFNEANFFQTADGVIHMMLRNENGVRMGVTESRDDGASWSAPVLTDFSNSVSRSHFGRLRDGRYFCVNCPTPPAQGVAPSTRTPRTPVILALSDDGVVFDRHFIVGDDAQGEPRIPGFLKHGRYGYPFLLENGDQVCVIYSTNKEDINLARFRLADLAG
ncbi:MAG: exo-alpha-sialidase [Burkholderiales bacterium]|nr:exo-alpha-sialidase [Burkholderiales bacterium]